jgi:ankyrin repeat protein
MEGIHEEKYVMEWLRSSPDEVHCVDSNEDTLLHIYSESRYESLQVMILEMYPDIIHESNCQGRTPIFAAISSRNARLVEKIVRIDPTVVNSPDEYGYSPVSYEMSSYGSAKIMETLWPHIKDDIHTLANMFVGSLGTHTKCVFVLENAPELYDYDFGHGRTILHEVASSSNELDATNVTRHICKRRPDLTSALDDLGKLPFHLCVSMKIARVLFAANPDAILVADGKGRTPLHYKKEMGLDVEPLLSMIREYPRVLSVRDVNGRTIAMNSFDHCYYDSELISNMFDINPESFLLKDTKMRTFVHGAAIYKFANWHSACERIVARYPGVLFEKDSSSKTPLDYAIEEIGGYGNFQLAKEIFISKCLRHTALPTKFWIFDGIVPHLTNSIGSILVRSEEEAVRAMRHMPRRDVEYIQSLLMFCDLSSDAKNLIVSKCYS